MLFGVVLGEKQRARRVNCGVWGASERERRFQIMKKHKLLVLAALLGATTVGIAPAQAQTPAWLEELLKQLPIPFPANFPTREEGAQTGGNLTEKDVALGLREALTVGTRNAVSQTGRVDGFFRDQAIKILMPEKLRPVERTLRAVGAGRQVDDFVLGMNRAAEKAAPQARGIFVDAIKGMSFSDVWGILRGSDTAATDYFRARTTSRLKSSFRPIVSNSMNQVGATRQYKNLVGRYANLPFMNRINTDIDGYVVDRALDGLFKVVAEEERDIRRNPAARVSQVLRDVFGNLGR